MACEDAKIARGGTLEMPGSAARPVEIVVHDSGRFIGSTSAG
jgi:hypothetical protein